MASVELADLATWLNPQGSTSPVIDAHTLEARLSDVASLFFPEEVCAEVGLSVLEGALTQQVLGPPEAARSILLNSQLFSENDTEHPEHDRSRGNPSLDKVEVSSQDPAHHPRNVVVEWRRRFEKALFDSAHVTRISVVLAAVARVVFNWLPPVPFVEFVTFYLLLLAVCGNLCAVRNSLRSTFAMSLTNGILHLILLVASQMFLPLPFAFSTSGVTHMAALGVMMSSYVEPYFFRFVSQSVALSLVLLDGYNMPSADKDNLEATCPVERSLASGTALTLALCLLLSSFMSETVQYTKRKSYSGK